MKLLVAGASGFVGLRPRPSASCSPRPTATTFPNREGTLGQALGKYLEIANLKVSTREAHECYIRRTIGPVLGEVKIRKLAQRHPPTLR